MGREGKIAGSALAAIAVGALLAVASPAWAATVTPSSQDYGSQPVGTTGSSVSFQLVTGSSDCTAYDYGQPPPYPCTAWAGKTDDTSSLGGGIGSTTRVGDFLVHNTNGSFPTYTGPPYQGSGYCQFEASFSPTAGGARSLTLTFPETPQGTTGTVSLTGTGLGSAGQRDAAIKKCKKKFRKGTSRRKKCLKHARLLPA